MSDDYLFDGTGEPDPDIARLEQMLGRLRSTATAPPIAERRTSNVGISFLVPALAAAATIALMVGFVWRNAPPAVSWEVAVIVGTPRVGAGTVIGEGRIAATSAKSRSTKAHACA
jgi:hypothetical protein